MMNTLRKSLSSSSKIGVRYFSISSPAFDKIGFIGLGNMGRGMAVNLLQKGNSVVAFDVVDSNLATVVEQGAEAANSPGAVAEQCSKVITMLPNNQIVQGVYQGPDGVLAAIKEGGLLIDCSTVDPALSKDLAAAAKNQGVDFVDAPVSGGVNAAAAGTLTFMCGAETQDTFNTAQQLLEHMGAKIIHCGGVGTGGAVKICNNMLLAVSMIGTSEAMNLGINLGLDPKLLADIMGSATGRCWSVDTYNPCPGVLPNVPSSNDYKGGFGTALMTKDLGLAQDAATRAGAATPLGSLSHQIYRTMCNNGFAEKDFSSAFKFIQKKDL
eukprot:TRINITY_DN4670_c0_g1_i2.p1 TRINITY_DN4670_c0_g1~~TRINITY_DN4670_c0_g1_i2.p1  ORF type:complete len:342 (+),score=89.46 TRINITY_DN4670_c0_g1_i2:54-1028(+)